MTTLPEPSKTYRRVNLRRVLAVLASVRVNHRLEIGGLRLGPFWIMSAVLLLSGVGIGLFTPASNNVALDLLPGRTAILSGLRLMFRSTGGTMGTALIVLGLELSSDKAGGLRFMFVLIAAFMLLAIPLTLMSAGWVLTRS